MGKTLIASESAGLSVLGAPFNLNDPDFSNTFVNTSLFGSKQQHVLDCVAKIRDPQVAFNLLQKCLGSPM